MIIDKMQMATSASQKVSLKPLQLMNLRTGQLLLGRGNKGSLAVLNGNSSQEVTEQEFPLLVVSTSKHDHDQDQNCDSVHSSQVQMQITADTGDTSDVILTRAEQTSKDCSKCFQAKVPMLEHTPQVHPVFVNYKKVSSEGYHTPLIDVAVAARKAVGETNVDAVQPTKNGWQICVKTEVDMAALLAAGQDLAGKHISLESQTFSTSSPIVKIVVKDLPLYEVTNEDVLEAVK